jgi:GTP-binding protein HflX
MTNQSQENMTLQPLEAMLIATYQTPAGKAACQEHLTELALLTETYGAKPVLLVPCHLRRYEAATYITEGKLEELVAMSKERTVDIIIIDEEISPAQQRNLQKIFEKPVMDRTEVILEVFSQRAQTKEARLQIELAKIKYQLPRLKNLWTHLSRQGGSVGGSGAYLKGEGEKQLEIDKRILKRRIEALQKEIDSVKDVRATQRTARVRSKIPTFAIVGYTNAGKSTLINALTDAGVFVEDKLFATLDTTTRKFTLPNNQDILLIDTVGFIRKLPHLLVAAFKSTLEEAVQADTLIHLIDASNPQALSQAEAALAVLKELGAGNKPIITVLNKIDHLEENADMAMRLRIQYPKTVSISALKKQGLEDLFTAMIEEIKKQRQSLFLRIPQSDYSAVSEVIRSGNVLQRLYDENDVLIEAELDVALADKMKGYLCAPFYGNVE